MTSASGTAATINSGSAPFFTALSLYCRGRDGRLLHAEGRHSSVVKLHWPAISEHLRSGTSASDTVLPSGLVIRSRSFDISVRGLASEIAPPASDHGALRSREMYRSAEGYYVGLICDRSQDHVGDPALRKWIETMWIVRTNVRPPAPRPPPPAAGALLKILPWPFIKCPSPTRKARRIRAAAPRCCAPISSSTAEAITVLFEDKLRNTAAEDHWDRCGRAQFLDRVLAFVGRDETIHCVLPAFPCKSPNAGKVGGACPDMAERIALETLLDFSRSVRAIYSPGATVEIIHDGHLLSSCIGADDKAISEYEESLGSLYRSLTSSCPEEGEDAIVFSTLTDLLFSPSRNGGDLRKTFKESWLGADPDLVINPLATELSAEPEMVRGIVMASSGIDRTNLRALIKAQHPSTLATYRGLSRFMLHDLPDTFTSPPKPISTSQRKKTASACASEMIVRNQSFSNLLSLLFPASIRLSIHAHDNRGPKYGIRLFPRRLVRAVADLEARHEPAPLYDFQIPTPWHNSIAAVEGDEMLYLCKASAAREAVRRGWYTGGWVVGGGPGGGHFRLRDLRREESSNTSSDSSMTVAAEGDVMSECACEKNGVESVEVGSEYAVGRVRMSLGLAIARKLTAICARDVGTKEARPRGP